MKLKNKIISGLLTATTLVSLCAFSAGAVSTDKKVFQSKMQRLFRRML